MKGKPVSTNFATFARPKHLELADPQIALDVAALGNNQFAVTLTAARPALWAWLELAGVDATFSDNFMHLCPGEPCSVVVTPSKSMTLKQFTRALTARSLIDTYR